MVYTPPTNLNPAWVVGLIFDGMDLNMQDVTVNKAKVKYPRTGNLDAGATNFGLGETTYTFTGTIIVDADSPALPDTDSKKPAAARDGVNTYAGKAAILTYASKGGGMGGAEYTVSGEFAGPVVVTPIS